MKLAPAAARIVADAQHEASRRKHGAVTAEHLLFALLAHGVAWRAKLPPPCRQGLRAIVARELDRLPATNAYRDAIPPALAKDVVDALRPSRWSIRETPIAPRELLVRLWLVPRVRDWFGEAQMDDALVDDVVMDATALAAGLRHLTVQPEHFLRVIAGQRWLAPFFGFDAPPALAAELDRRLPLLPSHLRDEQPSLREDLAVLVAKTKVNARMAQRPATADMLLCIALRDDEIFALFEAADMNVPALQQFLAHGHRDVPPAPTSGLVDVVFHDDDFTPIELVKEIMERKFQLPPGESKQRIHTAHDEGEVVVATLRADDAILRADETRLRARDIRVPLRVTLRSAS